jgi:hypothetical protein
VLSCRFGVLIFACEPVFFASSLLFTSLYSQSAFRWNIAACILEYCSASVLPGSTCFFRTSLIMIDSKSVARIVHDSKPQPRYIFLLSPASLSGRRAKLILGPSSNSKLAIQLRLSGAPLGEIFSFISGLYFRGKLAYATAFSNSGKARCDSVQIITSAHGLVSPHAMTSLAQLRHMADVPIHISNPQYRAPLERDVLSLADQIDTDDRVVLLGSVATPKYVEPLWNILGNRLVIPAAFIGLGDMERGSLMLRAVRERKQLSYVGVTPISRKSKSQHSFVPARA